jgi:succinate dehydrogenase / fumarate reductase flavoprotein subunit
MSLEWRKVNLILTLTGDKLELTHKPLPVMRPDLLGLFDKSELKKYMTEEELAGLPGPQTPASSATAAAEEGH